jgi:D-amino-acid oxidase
VRAVVAGAGVIGLTCAVALQRDGWEVEVVARDEPTTSEAAGGLWLPYSTGNDERTLRWARETYDWLEAGGHAMVDYVHRQRVPEPPWISALPPDRIRQTGEHEWIARVPLVQMPHHLTTLRGRVHTSHKGVRSTHPTALGADLVVDARGLGADDPDLVPTRGQVVYLEPVPGVPCICDEDELTYVLPRGDVIVCGGTHQPGDADLAPREHETRDILERCTRLVPELEGAAVVGVRVGLRPVRRGGVRLEREGDVIHCYGHGGAGLTLSWGCAREVAAIARTAAAR